MIKSKIAQKLVARCFICSREILLSMIRHLVLLVIPIVDAVVDVMTLVDYVLFETKF